LVAREEDAMKIAVASGCLSKVLFFMVLMFQWSFYVCMLS